MPLTSSQPIADSESQHEEARMIELAEYKRYSETLLKCYEREQQTAAMWRDAFCLMTIAAIALGCAFVMRK